MANQEVTVVPIQEDRDAANELAALWVQKGVLGQFEIAQLFARHRIAAEARQHGDGEPDDSLGAELDRQLYDGEREGSAFEAMARELAEQWNEEQREAHSHCGTTEWGYTPENYLAAARQHIRDCAAALLASPALPDTTGRESIAAFQSLDASLKLEAIGRGKSRAAQATQRFAAKLLPLLNPIEAALSASPALPDTTGREQLFSRIERCLADPKLRPSQADVRALLSLSRQRADERMRAVRKLLDDWFAPWGSWKTEWWEDLSGDKPWDANTMLEIIRAALEGADHG